MIQLIVVILIASFIGIYLFLRKKWRRGGLPAVSEDVNLPAKSEDQDLPA